MSSQLRAGALAWRHCPHGLHELLSGGALFVPKGEHERKGERTGERPSDVQGEADGTSEGSGHIYSTRLRAPIERMMSWHAWCSASSKDLCNIGARGLEWREARQETVNEARRRNASLLTAFYSVRERRMRSVALPSTARAGTHAPLRLESRLDYNYQVRPTWTVPTAASTDGRGCPRSPAARAA